jgi:hypothetical protein
MALQTLREHNHKAHVLFINLVNAYDTVNHELLWKILEKFGIPPQMIKVLQKLYTNVSYHMSVAGKKRAFESTCGVKQGGNLGPILFNFYDPSSLNDNGTLKPPIFAGTE